MIPYYNIANNKCRHRQNLTAVETSMALLYTVYPVHGTLLPLLPGGCRGVLGCEVVGVALRLPAPPRQQPAGPPQLLHEAPLPPPLLARPRRRAPAGRPQPRGRGAADHGVHAGRCPGSCHHLVLTPHSLTFTSCNNVNLNISIPSEVEVSVSSLLKHYNFKSPFIICFTALFHSRGKMRNGLAEACIVDGWLIPLTVCL